ncbi:MAG: hypothetical protein AB7E13_11880 [Arcobacteraceae bacterium]
MKIHRYETKKSSYLKLTAMNKHCVCEDNLCHSVLDTESKEDAE